MKEGYAGWRTIVNNSMPARLASGNISPSIGSQTAFAVVYECTFQMSPCPRVDGLQGREWSADLQIRPLSTGSCVAGLLVMRREAR